MKYNKIIKILIITLVSSSVFGCQLFKEKEKIIYEYIEKPNLNLTHQNSVNAEDVFFEVHLDTENDERQLVCTDAKEFENLALNLHSMLNYIFIQREVIRSYKKYYESEYTTKDNETLELIDAPDAPELKEPQKP